MNVREEHGCDSRGLAARIAEQVHRSLPRAVPDSYLADFHLQDLDEPCDCQLQLAIDPRCFGPNKCGITGLSPLQLLLLEVSPNVATERNQHGPS